MDGHIVLTRDLAMQNHYPAIDVLKSVSRVMDDITDKTHRDLSNKLKKTLATYRKNEDLINIGAYTAGSSPDIDDAIEKSPAIHRYLTQGIDECATLAESRRGLEDIFKP